MAFVCSIIANRSVNAAGSNAVVLDLLALAVDLQNHATQFSMDSDTAMACHGPWKVGRVDDLRKAETLLEAHLLLHCTHDWEDVPDSFLRSSLDNLIEGFGTGSYLYSMNKSFVQHSVD